MTYRVCARVMAKKANKNIEQRIFTSILTIYLYRAYARDVSKFLNPKIKEPPKFISLSGIRGAKFTSVYNFSAQYSVLRLETSTF